MATARERYAASYGKYIDSQIRIWEIVRAKEQEEGEPSMSEVSDKARIEYLCDLLEATQTSMIEALVAIRARIVEGNGAEVVETIDQALAKMSVEQEGG